MSRFWLLVPMTAAPLLMVVWLVRWTARTHPNVYGPGPDPLRLTVTPMAPGALHRLPVAVTEAGQPFHMTTLYNHILVAGATGSGKGSAVWSLLLALQPHVRAGTVQVWGIDPKGGMELGIGAALFRTLVTTPAAAASLLEVAVAAMGRRATELREEGLRRMVPTPERSHVVIVIDELGSLTGWADDAAIRRRITRALSVLLSQGRAVGVSIVAATQDPRKEVLAMRDLFPTRVALRTTEAEHADLILGRGAQDRGAHTHRIPRTQPGTAYVLTETRTQPVRIRFAYPTDDHIRRAVAA